MASTVAFLIALIAFLGGCGGGTTTQGTTGTFGASASSVAVVPVTVSGAVPAGATQVRLRGFDVEGEEVSSTTQPAATTVTMAAPEATRTLVLEYLNADGATVASFAESVTDARDLPATITDPPLVLAPLTHALPTKSAAAGLSSVGFSFAFVGCNRAQDIRDSGPVYPGQVSHEELASTANVAQLRQHFEDIKSLNPRPQYVFLCGDVVAKGKISPPPNQAASWYPDDASLKAVAGSVEVELQNWNQIRARGKYFYDRDGLFSTASSDDPARLNGSLVQSMEEAGIKIVVLPGNHEMCYKIKWDKNQRGEFEYPNRYAGEAFVRQMGRFIRNSNGPAKDTIYDAGNPLDLADYEPGAQGAQRDESRLSYTFQDGVNVFMVVNTDTYMGDSTYTNGGDASTIRDRRIPLRWMREQLLKAQNDPSVENIFVFGHRPIERVGNEAGVSEAQKRQFLQLLNNPGATTKAALSTPNESTKVRGFFCAHAHLFSTKQPSFASGPVQQVVCGAGGSGTDPEPSDEPHEPGDQAAAPGKPYPWFGFTLVSVRSVAYGPANGPGQWCSQSQVDVAFFGRNVHPSARTPCQTEALNPVERFPANRGCHWWEQEPLKLRTADISGPGGAPRKTPKCVRRIYLGPCEPF